MPLKVFNTLNQRIEVFKPLRDNTVGIYVCGPTVYDYSHAGHARTYIAFDIIVRYLRYKGFEVKYVVNITNIDDKIINRAKELKKDPLKLAEKFEEAFFDDIKALGIEQADVYPKVTDHIPEIIKMIQTLIGKGFAYVVNGDVYFCVTKVADYGRLSHQSLDEVKAGARVDLSEKKVFPVDFALWKSSKSGEPSWDSPWGKGRPGWHIECSVMSMKYLGPQFDIHGGAQDLIFPHHENEILQSEAASGEKPFVKYWLHTGFLNVDRKKMSKSLGNIITIGELLEKYSAEEFRLFVLSAHYRSPINLTYESLNQARKNLEKLYNLIHKINALVKEQKKERTDREEKRFYKELEDLKQKFLKAMDEDFNTPLALKYLFAIMRKTNTYLRRRVEVSKELLDRILGLFSELGSILGILEEVREAPEELPEELAKLIGEREKARESKDWEAADRIRLHLRELGVILEDTPEGVRWSRKRRDD